MAQKLSSSNLSPEQKSTAKRPPLLTLVCTTMIANASLNMLVPSMPSIARDLATSPASVQLTLTLYLVGIATGQLIYGPLSDRYGRRPILLIGLLGFIFATIAALASMTIDLLIISRFAQGFCGCSGMVLTRAIVRDVYSREETASALGFITMAMVIGPAISPTIGGVFDQYLSWRWIFVLQTGFCAIVVVATYYSLNETNLRRTASIRFRTVFADFGGLLKSPAYLGYVLSAGFSTWCFYSFLGGAPHVAVEIIGASPVEYGLYFLLLASGYSSGNFVSGKLATRVKLPSLIACGLAISGAAVAVLIVIGLTVELSLPSLFIPMMFMTFGNGISQPTTIASAISVRADIAGSASGLLGFIQMGIAGLASMVVGLLLGASHMPLLYQIAFGIIFAIIFFVYGLKYDRAAK